MTFRARAISLAVVPECIAPGRWSLEQRSVDLAFTAEGSAR